MKYIWLFLLLSFSLFGQSPPPAPSNGQLVIQRRPPGGAGPFWSYGVTPVTNQVLGWDGTKIVMTAGGGGGSAAWGSITGTLSDQTDLQAALDALQSKTGILALAGFSSITGTLPALNVGDLSATYLTLTSAAASYQPLDADLTALAALTGTNTIYYRSVANTWTPVTIGTGLSFSGGSLTATNGGTVTSVSVVTANGVSGSVATATTTPAITLTLGAITPSSVTSAGTVTGSNLSGTNTGDQTTITGNAGSATILQIGRTISITGDLAYTSPSFNGSGNVTAAGTLATVNSNVGTFGSTTAIPVVTVNAKGLITAVTTAAIPAAGITVDSTTVTGGTIGNVFYHGSGNVVREVETSYGGQAAADANKLAMYNSDGSFSASTSLVIQPDGVGTTVEFSSGSLSYSDSGGVLTLIPATPFSGAKNIEIPFVDGTFVTTGDTDTVTDTMLAGSISNAKLANSSITVGGASTALGGTVTASTILDSISSTRGNILYRGASGWAALNPGTSGYALVSNGTGADPSYQLISSGITFNSTLTSGFTSGDILSTNGTTVQKLTPGVGVNTLLATFTPANADAALSGDNFAYAGSANTFTQDQIMNGNLGLGGVTPTTRLQVVAATNSSTDGMIFQPNNQTTTTYFGWAGLTTSNLFTISAGADLNLQSGDSNYVRIGGSAYRMLVDGINSSIVVPSFSFGVGGDYNKTPLTKLDVWGSMRVYGAWSSSTNWEGLDFDVTTTPTVYYIGSRAGSGGGTVRPVTFGYDGTELIRLSSVGVSFTKTITAGGTTGAQTINKTSGSVNFAAAATSLVVTNSLCTTSSVIIATVATNDASMTAVRIVAGSGSFTIYADTPPAAETRVNFIITN